MKIVRALRSFILHYDIWPRESPDSLALIAARQAHALGDAKVVQAWKRVAIAWLTGVLFFSGSIYTLSLNGPSWLGPVTPLGGIILITGWFMIAWTRTPTKS